MTKAINPKVSQEQIRVAGQIKRELQKIYDATLILAKQHGYRFKPSESRLGWFEVLDGNNKTVSIICPVGMVDPIDLCRTWAEQSITLVKHIDKWEAWQLIPEVFTCEPIHEQQKQLSRAVVLQKNIDVVCKKIRTLEEQISDKKKSLESLNWELSQLS